MLVRNMLYLITSRVAHHRLNEIFEKFVNKREVSVIN